MIRRLQGVDSELPGVGSALVGVDSGRSGYWAARIGVSKEYSRACHQQSRVLWNAPFLTSSIYTLSESVQCLQPAQAAYS